MKQGSSPVSSFHPGTAGASKLYDKVQDLLVAPLPHSALSTVISSYEKTIGMSQLREDYSFHLNLFFSHEF